MKRLHKRPLVFLLLSLSIAVADGLFVYFNYQFTRDAFLAEFQTQRDTFAQAFHAQVNSTTDNLLLIATLIANNKQVQTLFLQGRQAVEAEGGGAGGKRAAAIRQALYQEVAPEWNKAINNLNARQLHFHLGPGSLSFLRVHRPEKFGDRMDATRFIIVATNADQQPRTGFETGRVYSGLRGVVPVRAFDAMQQKSVYVGALEAGTSYSNALKAIDAHFGVGAAVLLKREHITAAVWPEFVKKKYGQEIEGCRCFLEASSRKEVSDILRAAIAQTGSIEARDDVRYVQLEGKTLALSVVPIRDYRGTRNPNLANVGAAVFWRDISAQMQAYRQEQGFNIVYAVLVYLLIELLLYMALRTVSRHLQRQIDLATSRLSEAQQIAHLGNWELDHATGELYWSDEVYRIFEIEKDRFGSSYEDFIRLIHPDDRRLVDEQFHTALQHRTPYTIEHRLLMRDGRVKHVQERVVTHYGAKGAPTTTLGTVHDITEQKMAELTLKEAERRWVMALEGAGHGVWDWDTRSNRVFYSETWKEMLGFTENEIGPHVSEWRSRIHPDDQAAALAVLKQHFNGASDTYRSEHRLRCRDGSYKWILDQGMVFERSVDRQPIRVVGTHTDITQSKQAQLQLEQNHRMITGLLKNTSDAYIAVDAQYRVGYFNQAAERLWNISSSEVVGASLWDALPELASFFYLAFTKAMSHGRPYTTEGYYPPLSKTLDLRLYPWENGLWAFFQDISDRKAAESRLKRLASTDAMTGAYNRMRLSEILRAEIRRASRYHTLFSLVMLDIDHFKEVNDTFGHAVGDQVILGVVERISRILRGSDSLGRWGGEEFVILLPQTSLEAACNKAERCRQAVANTPFATADQVTISLGVAAYKPGLDFDELLDEADKRLYRAKASGRNRVVCGEPPIPPPQATPSDGFETPETPQDP